MEPIQSNKIYPIGIQNFEKMRKGGYFYVDKTALVYRLGEEGRPSYPTPFPAGKDGQLLLPKPPPALRQEPAHLHPRSLLPGKEGTL